jgi:hypothetical protein
VSAPVMRRVFLTTTWRVAGCWPDVGRALDATSGSASEGVAFSHEWGRSPVRWSQSSKQTPVLAGFSLDFPLGAVYICRRLLRPVGRKFYAKYEKVDEV